MLLVYHQGFGFITYSSGQEADAAIGALHEQELDGRRIKYVRVLDPSKLSLIGLSVQSKLG